MKRTNYAFALVLLFCYTSAFTQEWKPKDIINTEYARSISISKDNTKVLWSKRKAVKEKDRFVNDLYLTYLDRTEDGKPVTVQLTQSDDNDHSGLFSADGKYVYFLSGRDKGKKLWKLNLLGGEAEEVHEFDNSVSGLDWLNDSTLVYLSNEGKTHHEKQLEKKKDDTQVIEDTVFWTRNQVYTMSIKDKEPRGSH